MPAEFLVDRDGIIRESFYGKDEGDHLAFEKIQKFACQETLNHTATHEPDKRVI